MRRVLLLVIGVATLLLFAGPGSAVPPARISIEEDVTFRSGLWTAACGIPVYVHVEGAGTTTLFYDQSGTQVIREFDTFTKLTITLFSPLDEGGTGKSFTIAVHSPATFLYPDGTQVGDPAIIIFNGVQNTSGPGGPRIVGHEVEEGIIIGLTPDGVPIVDGVALISQSGQFDVAAVRQGICAALSGP